MEKNTNYARIASIVLWVCVGLGIILGLGDATAGWADIELGGHDGLPDFLAWFIRFGAAGISCFLAILFVGIAKDISAIRAKLEQ